MTCEKDIEEDFKKDIREWVKQFLTPKTWEKARNCYYCNYYFSTTHKWGTPARSTKCPRCGLKVDSHADVGGEE